METEIATARIRALNDAARWSLADGVVYFTRGVAALHPREQAAILDRVRTFDDFTEDGDPWGEHDFGAFEHERHKIFWKIDCYDLLLRNGSRDPSDPALSRRVLTVMFAKEVLAVELRPPEAGGGPQSILRAQLRGPVWIAR